MAIADDVDGMGATPADRTMISRSAYRPCLAIAGSVVAFATLIGRAGYVPAVIATVLIASYGSGELTVRQAVVLAAIAATTMSLLFVGLLDQPLPLFTTF